MQTAEFPPLDPSALFAPTDPAQLTDLASVPEAVSRVVGQEEAVTALELAAALGPQYGHAFVVGPAGYGRHAITRQVLGAVARQRAAPLELLYVARFDDPLRPQLLRLPAGVGQRLVAAMRAFCQALVRHSKTMLDQRKWSSEALAEAVDSLLTPLEGEFSPYPEVARYLAAVRRDLEEGEPVWLTLTQEGEQLTWSIDPTPLRRYEAHLLVGYDPAAGAPVVESHVVSHALLFGWVESEVRDGERVSDHMLIRAGRLAEADGGFLLIDAQALLSDPLVCATLLRTLKAGEVVIEPPPDHDAWGAVVLRPDPIPVAVQVVVIGTPEEYQLLCERHTNFTDRFSVVPFAESMARTPLEERRYAALFAALARAHGWLPPQPEALAALLEEAARAAPDRQRLSLAVRRWSGLLAEANALARQRGAAEIDAAAVAAAIAARFVRNGSEWREVMRAIAQGELLIATAGARIGQINGLVVFEEGAVTYGHPVRITATVRLGGEGELIDIERESDLGGAIHSKGVLILAAFLAGRFARHRPLKLAASLVMEQSYGLVEGDSASLAEACALLSAIGQLPLAQGIAVTGSINQLGEVQPVGAVNEKIEGWFAACATRGLTGAQGVIVPRANGAQLMVRAEVRQAVAAGQFHVWAVATIDEAMALLTGRPVAGPQSGIAAVTQALARFWRWHDEPEGAWRRPWQRRKRD